MPLVGAVRPYSLSVSFRLIMPGHSAKMVSLNDVTSALTQHSINWEDKQSGKQCGGKTREVFAVHKMSHMGQKISVKLVAVHVLELLLHGTTVYLSTLLLLPDKSVSRGFVF